jgi:protein SCO1
MNATQKNAPMTTVSRRAWVAAVAAGTAAGAVVARASDLALPTAAVTPRESIRERYLPNVVLRTQDDREVRFYDDLVKDKVVTLNFIYSTCADGTCPLITANLVKVQRLLGARVGRDIFMYSITLDPRHDTPKELQRYARAYGVQPGWEFLTGMPEDVEYLRRKLRFVDRDPKVDSDTSRHSGNVRYGNEPRMQWAACQGQAKPSWIAESILWVAPKTG